MLRVNLDRWNGRLKAVSVLSFSFESTTFEWTTLSAESRQTGMQLAGLR